jgi:hypothetical protein
MRRGLALCLVLVGCGAPPPDESDEELSYGPPTAQVHWMKGAAGKQPNPLIDHGGEILSASNTYAIWWGAPSLFPSDAVSGIESELRGFNGSAYLALVNQYMRGTSASSTFMRSFQDTTAPPGHGPSTSTIVGEACAVIVANGLKPDPNALYAVFTSNFPHVNYCAWHDHGTCNGVDIQVAYLPNLSGVKGCDPGDLYHCNGYSQGTRALADALAHEYLETITDADLNAWYDKNGFEIADKCNFQFGSCVTFTTGAWQLQKQWSNAAASCVQQ